jgi:hypothetical protein
LCSDKAEETRRSGADTEVKKQLDVSANTHNIEMALKSLMIKPCVPKKLMVHATS